MVCFTTNDRNKCEGYETCVFHKQCNQQLVYNIQMTEAIFQKIRELQQEANHYEKEPNKLNDCMELHKEILAIKLNSLGQHSEQYHRTSFKLCELNNLAGMVFMQKKKFDLSLVLLKKAEAYALHSNFHKAVTFNNMACYYRRINKFRLALTFLQHALALEVKMDNQVSLADTHLNMCAVLSHLGKHNEALEHILMTVVLLQDQLLKGGKQSSQRISVLAIAYHNMGVELEYLKRFDESINAYKKAVEFGRDNMPAEDKLVKNLEDVLGNAEETVKTLQMKKKVARKVEEEKEKFEKLKTIYGEKGEKERPQTAGYYSTKTKTTTNKEKDMIFM